MCGLSFLTRDWTHLLCIGRWILNHLTIREVLNVMIWYMYILWNFFTIIRLVTHSSPHNIVIFCVCVCTVRFSKSTLLALRYTYNTVFLITAIILYIRSPKLIHLITWSLYSLTNISPFLPATSTCSHQSTLYEFSLFGSTHKLHDTVFVFPCFSLFSPSFPV